VPRINLRMSRPEHRIINVVLALIALTSMALPVILLTRSDHPASLPAASASEDVAAPATSSTTAADQTTTTKPQSRQTTTTTTAAPATTTPTRHMRPATTDSPTTTAPPAPTTTAPPPPPAPIPTSEPEGLETRNIQINNLAVNGIDEDTPVYLSTRMEPYCKDSGCAVPGTDMATGHWLIVNCQRQGANMTNGRSGSDGNWSTLWYGVFRDGGVVYISEVYVYQEYRGGLGLPGC
jgi:hypothetical protein